ncbi:MAG: protein-L-isoaspartate(D-aspartate) O-methyltransferase [Dehalococcoidia bacterium]
MKGTPLDRLIDQVAQSVSDLRVLEAMRSVRRERFLRESERQFAFLDTALPIGMGQTISQPTIVAVMTEALRLTGEERVLEVGTGSGYQAAILSLLAGEVVSVEVVPELRERAAALLDELGIGNVHVVDPRGLVGCPDRAPFDRIIVTAACPAVPPSLLEQLGTPGIMVLPVGSRNIQELVMLTRKEESLERQDLGGCRFVPLTGPEGF